MRLGSWRWGKYEAPTNLTATKKGWQEFLPDFPIALMVLLAATVGWIAYQCGITKVDDSHVFVAWAAKHPCSGTMFLGSAGAGVAIFFPATTDMSKVWHCFFFALTCGTAGQPLVLEAVNSIGFDLRLGINIVNRPPGVTPATTSAQHQNQPTNETFRKTTNPFFNTHH